MNAYLGIYERYADDAAFLWHLRSLAVDQPHYLHNDVRQLDLRIESQLDGLMTAPEEAWTICRDAMMNQEPGEVFTATVLAFRSLEVLKIQEAVECGLSTEMSFRGLVSALGWLPGRLCHSWIKKFLTSKDHDHKYLALAACSVRREDPRDYLTALLQRSDCVAHPKLYSRALRLVGELKRRDLMPVLRLAMHDERHEVSFWSNWSVSMLGDRSAIPMLRPVVVNANTLQAKAIHLCFRSLPIEEAREWIGMLARDPSEIRNVIHATSALGDPHAIPWLIAQMHIPMLSRLAGEAFTTITGIDLNASGLALEGLPDLAQQLPNDDPNDDDVGLDEDEHLAFPDPYKVTAVWERYQNRFTPARRYFLGKPVSTPHLNTVFSAGNQRHRRIAAMELALAEPDQILANYRMSGYEKWAESSC